MCCGDQLNPPAKSDVGALYPDAGNQGIESDEQQPVDRGRGDASRGFTAKHIQLVPKYKVLGLQRCPRSEQPDESGPDQFAEIIQQP